MNEKFLKLNTEKRERILQAAYEEFSAHTYEDASTNRMAKKAEISKGTIFYYFNSKQELYLYLVEHTLEFLQGRYLFVFEGDAGDFIERCKRLAELDMQLLMEAPYIIEFFSKLYFSDETAPLSTDLKEKINDLIGEAMNGIYQNVNLSLFRQDLSDEETMKIIKWTFDGYMQEVMTQLKGKSITLEMMLPHFERFERVLATLKKAFYN